MRIVLFGIGNFGFALLKHLSNKFAGDASVQLVAHDRDHALMAYLRKHRHHPNHHRHYRISDSILIEDSLSNCLKGCDILILAVTSTGILPVLKKVLSHVPKRCIIVNTAKALHYTSGKPYSELIMRMPFFKRQHCQYAVLSGGTIARDLFEHQPLGIDIACRSLATARKLKKVFESENLFVYPHTDVRGIEYAGAYKNVISILAGIINGLGFSYGSETHFISRAAEEVRRLVASKTRLDPYTFSMQSQAWGNDLWMSCTGQTRNREFGMLIGKGFTTTQALQKMDKLHKTVEGVNTLRSLNKKFSGSYPLIKSVIDVVFNKRKPRTILSHLNT